MNYEIWATQGQGGEKVDEFDSVENCLGFVKHNKGSASFMIIDTQTKKYLVLDALPKIMWK